jgi:plastocyanin
MADPRTGMLGRDIGRRTTVLNARCWGLIAIVSLGMTVAGISTSLRAQDDTSADTTEPLYASAAPSPSPDPSGSPAAPSAGAKREVTFGGSLGRKYVPDMLEITAGTTVVFKGQGNAKFEKWPLVCEEKEFDTVSTKESVFPHKFNNPGKFTIYCESHPEKDSKGLYKMHCYITVKGK